MLMTRKHLLISGGTGLFAILAPQLAKAARHHKVTIIGQPVVGSTLTAILR